MISVIVPCYNARSKIGRCLASLRKIDLSEERYEIIFVDDCSTDGTYEFLVEECRAVANWSILRLKSNSGSPSEPRNRGVLAACGTYIFFLDCDDEILPDTLRLHLMHAEQTRADIVRGYLLAEVNGVRTEMNRLSGWDDELDVVGRVRLIVSKQSTTVCSLIRREVLIKCGILWRSDLRMGEDTLFLISVLAASSRIEYIDHPTFVYVKSSSFTPSSTQTYGDRELRNHLVVWEGSCVALARLGIDFVEVRLQVGMQAALMALIFLNKGDVSVETFQEFSRFVRSHWNVIARFGFSKRLKAILEAVFLGDFSAFCAASRPRLVVAGHDLKFIKGILPHLERYFDVRFDEWKGHDAHDEKKSRELLEWGELLWCEWLLGNAVWYARNKTTQQKLIVRMHRFELGRNFGETIAVGNVDSFVTVSTLFLERLLERFANIPRHKARLLHNYVDVSSYKRTADAERRFRLAMIGILPSRKGFLSALKVLMKLRSHDPRYTLDVFGHSAEDLPWLANDTEEMRYFSNCNRFIVENGLSEAVKFRGHANIQEELAKSGIGITLSMSESVRELPCFESFHLAVADGFAAGGLGLVRYWEGAEYIWPSRFVLSSGEEVVDRVLEYRDDPERYAADCEVGLRFVTERYGADRFIDSFRALYR